MNSKNKQQTPTKTDKFYNNPLYRLLSNRTLNSNELLEQLNSLLHEQPDLVEFTHPKEGSYFHVVCHNFNRQENIAYRIIYALSNAGGDPNVTDKKGNTALHEVIKEGLFNNNFDLIQALFRIGIDPRIVNRDGKTASDYIKNKPQLTTFYNAYGEGIWDAIEMNDLKETQRLMNGFIKVDCKHNSNKTLLDKARDLNSTFMIDVLADYQVTTEFVHSILAFDWDRASLIYEHEKEFFKPNSMDSIHRLTSLRQYSKSLLDYCLESQCSKPFEILFHSPLISINVNILCTDGLPFFFHCFQSFISKDIRNNILLNSNMLTKSSKGETFLFHLIHLYSLNTNPDYIHLFKNIIINNPLLIAQRNEDERTIVEVIELSTSMNLYSKLRPFYDAIKHLIVLQLKNDSVIEQLILNSFGYDLIIFCRNKTFLMTKYVYRLLRNLKLQHGLTVWISSFLRAVATNDLMKIEYILKLKSNIYLANDSFGRTCAHVAVLHQQHDILKFFAEKYPNVINSKDNMNRTCFHYACLMNDMKSIEILEQIQAIQSIDGLNFTPNDYLLNHKLCFKEFYIDDFSKVELQRKSLAMSNFLKIVFYPSLKKAIETSSIEDIKLLNSDLTKMGCHLKDFNPISQSNDFVQGQRYIPFLFVGLEHRAILAIKCLLQLGLPFVGKIYMMRNQLNQYFLSKYFSLRPDILQCFDIVELIDGINDDDELKDAFKQELPSTETGTNGTLVKIEHEHRMKLKILARRQMILANLINGDKKTDINNSKSCVIL
ncbi:hypothetical protein I4U23_026234 [Adineta vaga]|nr:hypothetical protein I4U23_026234 [Adineta vaga]